MKTSFLKLLLLAAIGCGALNPRQAAAQPAGDSYTNTILPGLNLIANQLDQGSNTLAEVLPSVPDGSQLLKWNEATGTFHTDTFDDADHLWLDATSGSPSTTKLDLYEAAFLFNPGAAYPLVIAGQQRANVPPPPVLEPEHLHYLSGPVIAPAYYVDMTSLAPEEGALFIRWNAATQSYQTNRFTGGAWQLGEPAAAAGEGAILYVPRGLACPDQQTFLRLFSGANQPNVLPVLLPGGAQDLQFDTAMPPFPAANPYVPSSPNPYWLANGPASKWIGIGNGTASSNGVRGVYAYTNRFLLPCLQAATIQGRWAADDSGSIWLNGIHTPNDITGGWGFDKWKPVAITSGFQTGLNTLVFYVTNLPSLSPTGLRTELTGTFCRGPGCAGCLEMACANQCTPQLGQATVVNYPMPSVTNRCGGTVTSLSCTPPSGSAFPAGTTTVTCTAQDNSSTTASCSFTVTVAPNATRVWNTGMTGASGNAPLNPGETDTNYTLVSVPPGGCPGPAQVIVTDLSWVPNGPNSSWIGGALNSQCINGLYQYRLCFYLPCTNSASVKGRWAADDIGYIFLNDQPTGITSATSPPYSSSRSR